MKRSSRGGARLLAAGRWVVGALIALAASAPASAYTLYSTRPAFDAAVGTSITDDYSSPGYDLNGSASLDIFGNAAMSAVFGETRYESTGHANLNIIFAQDIDARYCAGCNGSFLLDFSSTSLAGPSGVYGVAMDTFSFSSLPYFAFVSFGDGSTADLQLSTAFVDFFGITSDEGIRSIHFGLSGGAPTTDGGFFIDNLTFAAQAVPEPASLVLVAVGLAALAARRRRLSA